MAKAKTTEKAPVELVAVTTTEPVRHDGEDIPVGTKLEMEAPAAKALIEAGAAVPLVQSDAPADPNT